MSLMNKSLGHGYRNNRHGMKKWYKRREKEKNRRKVNKLKRNK